MPKAVVTFFCLLFLFALTAVAEVKGNREFCGQALAEVCDSLTAQLELPQRSALTLAPVSGNQAELLQDQLAQSLQRQSHTVYLSDSTGGRPLLQATLERFELEYRGVSAGLFSSLRVERSCAVSVSARLLSEERRLLQTAAVLGFEKRETIDYKAAESARSGVGIYAPPLPPSLLQRVVEPALIITITGALVYLFFASR